MNKIKRVSLFFRVFFQAVFVALPLLLLVSWINAPRPLILLKGFVQLNPVPLGYRSTHLYEKTGVTQEAILHALTHSEKVVGLLVSAIPLLVQLFILYSLIKLFRLYEKGEIFSVNHVKYIRNIGYALLVGQLIDPFYQLAMGLILTINNPPGHRFMSLTIDQTNIGILLTALLVILISWIMAEGFKLREEQQLTI